jgi:hypothetical protein
VSKQSSPSDEDEDDNEVQNEEVQDSSHCDDSHDDSSLDDLHDVDVNFFILVSLFLPFLSINFLAFLIICVYILISKNYFIIFGNWWFLFCAFVLNCYCFMVKLQR